MSETYLVLTVNGGDRNKLCIFDKDTILITQKLTNGPPGQLILIVMCCVLLNLECHCSQLPGSVCVTASTKYSHILTCDFINSDIIIMFHRL